MFQKAQGYPEAPCPRDAAGETLAAISAFEGERGHVPMKAGVSRNWKQGNRLSLEPPRRMQLLHFDLDLGTHFGLFWPLWLKQMCF